VSRFDQIESSLKLIIRSGMPVQLPTRLPMTLIDVAFRYRVPPGEREMSALDCVHEVYGVRKISFDQTERVIRVEFDISRLTEDDVAALLRGAGVDIQEKIMLIAR
jgi:hypothetical protein